MMKDNGLGEEDAERGISKKEESIAQRPTERYTT